MLSDYRTLPGGAICAGCKQRGDSDAFFHSAGGLVCKGCHVRGIAVEARSHDASHREAQAAVRLGLLVLVLGVGAVALARLVPRGPHATDALRPAVIATAAAVWAALSTRGRAVLALGRWCAVVGAGLCCVALALLVARL
jgi:hypothetical protein